MSKLAGSLFLIVYLSACNGVSLRTNMGDIALGKAVASTVEEYQQSEIFNFKYVGLGEVSTSYCAQTLDSYNHDGATIEDLKVRLRLQVQKKGGNAIVYHQCGPMEYPACYRYIECRAEGYELEI